MLDIDLNGLKAQLKAELKAEIEAGLKFKHEDEQEVELKDKEFHCYKQINYNVLTQKQIQGQKAENDTENEVENEAELAAKPSKKK